MFISKDEVLDKESFKAIENISICPLCNGIIINPYVCEKCEKCFCKSCIDKYNNEKGKKKCPFNCEKPVFKRSLFLNNILSQLKFKCKNGCDEEIDYQKLSQHYDEECSKIDYKTLYFELKKKYDEVCELLKDKNDINSFKSKFHCHTLNISFEKNMMWKCNECSKVYMFNSTKRYRCKQCDFDICDHCKIKEEKGEI